MFDEEGSDIIFAVGTPGSKWSAISHALIYADGVNISDITLNRTFETESSTYHFGNYFGPGMEYGKTFDKLEGMRKEELLQEFSLPYQSPGGIKLLKSHMFAQHLPFLAEIFPKAHFLLVHRSDKACLDWWSQSGGFSITFPDYGWYGDNDKMAKQIESDNRKIIDFANSYGSRFVRYRSMLPVLKALGLTYSSEHIINVASTEFEKKWGFGDQALDAIMETCYSMARLASICVVTPEKT